ncbi:hypothetical protein F2Q69_00056355 [Brassica cretica]|uniref:Uncharacterized protein n=4 Tax=Brassica TaxID=3705 RepID=A0A8S9MZ36_BRACR|nr:hypothetical protein F2Q69_00056355 [Brassica cretica]KAF3598026.1 hypothetical protein DY000_02026088 [Brassica cretica]
MGWRSSSSLCVIENVLYLYSWKIYWYHSRERLWKDFKGLEIYPRLSLSDQVKLIDYGGKMAVLWDEYECGMKKKIKKDLFGEPWGMLKSFDVVSTTSERHSLEHSLATTI